MSDARAPQPRLLMALGGAFVLLYHLFFTFDGFNTGFGGDDGMNLFHLHHHWMRPVHLAILDALQVITAEYRPAGALFYRGMFAVFGYDPLAFRIAIFLLLVFSIWLVYRLARELEAPRAAAALACLLFSYNEGLMDLQYNTGTVYDVLCFVFYFPALIFYISRRSSGAPLRVRDMALILVLYAAALDSKELAVTLPAAFLLYEAIYRFPDLRRRPLLLRHGSFLAGLIVLTVFYSRVKVMQLSTGELYRPHRSVAFALQNVGHFLEFFFYRKIDSYTIAGVILTAVVLVGLSLLIRSRAALFGTLFFFGALAPVAVIPRRGGFAAYVAFPGLVLAVACLLDFARERLVRWLKIVRYQQASSIVLFLAVAIVAGKYHLRMRNRWMETVHDHQHRLAEVMSLMKQRVPDFPPDFTVLLTDTAFPDHDWVIFFLARMAYGDHTVWVDRKLNLDQPPDLKSYDLLMSYEPSPIQPVPLRLFGWKLGWEPRYRAASEPVFTVESGRADATPHPVDFAPSAVKAREKFTLSVPGIAGVKIDAVYRLRKKGEGEEVFKPAAWCSLDGHSSCSMEAPDRAGTLILDWVRPQNGRWERTQGTLQIQ